MKAEKLGENGRILVRESGTEPVVRVMVEADSVETCEKYVDDVIEPDSTRPRIIAALEMLASKRDSRPAKKHGNLPV